MWSGRSSSGNQETPRSVASGASPKNAVPFDEKDAEEIHRKRVAQILRYISSMQLQGGPTSGSGKPLSFVRPVSIPKPFEAAASSKRRRATLQDCNRPFFQDPLVGPSNTGFNSSNPIRLDPDSDNEEGGLENRRKEFDESKRSRSSKRRRKQVSPRNLGSTHSSMSFLEDDPDASIGRVLFSIFDFQELASMEAAKTEGAKSLPFSFYSSASLAKQPKKRSFGRAFSGSSGGTSPSNSTAGCWLRLTRLTGSQTVAAPPPSTNCPQVQKYLRAWKGTSRLSLTLEDLKGAPPTESSRVRRWLKKQTSYCQTQRVRKLLEPMYNHLFEWYHQTSAATNVEKSDLDLIWGLGQAKLLIPTSSTNYDDEYDGIGNQRPMEEEMMTIVDGPLLEVRVEVELARDGALLVRPKQHTGVTLNSNVLAAIAGATANQDGVVSGGVASGGTGGAAAGSSSSEVARQLRQAVESLDATDLAPGEPSTYTSILKRIAVELSSGGTFISSAKKRSPLQEEAMLRGGQLVVTDAWCVYSSPKPSAVWARDALTFAERLSSLQPKSPTNMQLAVPDLPQALWALTHGPGALDAVHQSKAGANETSLTGAAWSMFKNAFQKQPPKVHADGDGYGINDVLPPSNRPQFPLPTSDAQNRIADLLLTKEYPAVVCEGPPGTGKTHTIANIVCAYLCQGKRVLVTSKGAPALSVLRERLPACVQELCVDVSMSESTGMRQLQQTVERLANKVAWVNTEREMGRSDALQQNIDDLELELRSIDSRLRSNAADKRELVQTQPGQDLFELALGLIEKYPWLIKTMGQWDIKKITSVHKKLESLIIPVGDPMEMVSNFESPPSDALVSMAAAKAGLALSSLKAATKDAIASIPMLGSRMANHCSQVKEQLEAVKLNDAEPLTKGDWYLIFQALEREKAIHIFCRDVLEPLFSREEWPKELFIECTRDDKMRMKHDIVGVFERASKLKKLMKDLEVSSKVEEAMDFEKLDKRRTGISSRIQSLAEELVAARVVAELSKNFSAEAQSALVKFAQVSGKAKFGKASQVSRLTQRQRRKRQEYLDAFERCVRYIPCWILTSSQISDYLPSECLFDLVVIDEASQSDVTVLPGMLRGKQWLIVGDGKQVSPTESFVSEEQIEMLKAAMPESPFEASMLPGHSFFDLCAQAFPKGRIILREHFRCAPEIISFSNAEFYNGNLVPLRLPTSTERLKPSLMDVRLRNGRKIGKINEQECDEIVKRIKKYVNSCTRIRKRSIGVISLVGDEQSRLIRGRLLDQIGPHKYKLHNILVGEPPSFQGAERDIVFLTMVCSPNSMVTQSQLMHAQRVNVALSRARDRMVLVRSIDTNHIPNEQDIKFSVLDFFARAKQEQDASKLPPEDDAGPFGEATPALSPFRRRAELLLVKLLEDRGFSTLSMGIVWDDAICVEDAKSSARAAICVEATGESADDWKSMLEQQKSIERVGWKCMRVDAVSFLANHFEILASIQKFLASVNVLPQEVVEKVADLGVVEAAQVEEDKEEVREDDSGEEEDPIVLVSSDEEDDDEEEGALEDSKPAAIRTARGKVDESDQLGNGETAADYGNVVGLDFLKPRASDFLADSDDEGVKEEGDDDIYSIDSEVQPPTKVRKKLPKKNGKDGKARRHGASSPVKLEVSVDRKRRSTSGSPTKSGSKRRRSKDPDNVQDLKEKQRAVPESIRHTFSHDDQSSLSSTISAEEDGDPTTASLAPSRASTKKRRQDRYARDSGWKQIREDDISHADYLSEVVPEPSNANEDDGYSEEIHEDDESFRIEASDDDIEDLVEPENDEDTL